jgi:DNA-binding transcriptional MerR regulator
MPRNRTRYDISELQTIKQAAKTSGVPLRTIYHFLERGAVKPLSLGGRMLLDIQTVGKLQSLRQGFNANA